MAKSRFSYRRRELAKAASVALFLFLSPFCLQAVEGEKVINPSAASQETRQEITSGTDSEGPSISVVLAYLGLMAGGAFFVINRMKKGRVGGLRNRSRGGIQLRGSHMLGNRQFLVVAEVEGQRMLLGVGPGFISHLSSLKPTAEGELDADDEAGNLVDATLPSSAGGLSGFSQMLSRGLSRNDGDFLKK